MHRHSIDVKWRSLKLSAEFFEFFCTFYMSLQLCWLFSESHQGMLEQQNSQHNEGPGLQKVFSSKLISERSCQKETHHVKIWSLNCFMYTWIKAGWYRHTRNDLTSPSSLCRQGRHVNRSLFWWDKHGYKRKMLTVSSRCQHQSPV